MPRKIALVSCASRKSANASSAETLYTSDLFRKAGTLATQKFDGWYILSAKHGLLNPQTQIEPYDETLNRTPTEKRLQWASQVARALTKELAGGEQLFFFAGHRYREFLEPMLREKGFLVFAPMAGLSIGRQLQWLNAQLSEKLRLVDLDTLYDLLRKLSVGVGGARILRESSGKLPWPTRGLYFFFERDERRSLDPSTCRIVRVGTHAVSLNSKSTLWGRLRTHKGSDDGRGNHRGSIFRLHVGAALQASGAVPAIHSWSVGQSARKDVRLQEEHLEREVSAYIGQMAVLWLDIGDLPGSKSDRAFLESNIIGLLSGPTGPVDLPSEHWLGRHSPTDAIRQSGLWNVDHVSSQYDRRFIDVLGAYVDVTTNSCVQPSAPLAPKGWERTRRVSPVGVQLSMDFHSET